MTLQDLGNIGEFVGAIGVIASLVYLAVQIRQNTRSLRAATYQSLAEATAATSTHFLSDPELARIVRVGSVGSERLSEDELARFHAFLVIAFRRFDSIFLHYRQGTLPEDAWQAYWHSYQEILANPGVQTWWKRNSRNYTEALRERVAREITSPDAPRGAAQQDGST